MNAGERLARSRSKGSLIAIPAPNAVVRILGIDPGSRVTGWGIIEVRGANSTCIAFGDIRCASGPLAPRLLKILRELAAVIEQYAPAEAAIEQVFVKANVGTALILGQARGAAICAVAAAGLEPAEYAPASVKSAIVGTGRAEKAQVQHMIRAMLKLTVAPPADAADALAIALCHAQMRRAPAGVRLPGRRRSGRWLSL